jgi:hypothetical protein
MDNDLKTSIEWQRLCPSPKVIGFEGWNDGDQWQNVEMSYLEYQQRVFLSTCAFISLSPPPLPHQFQITTAPANILQQMSEQMSEHMARDARVSQQMARQALMNTPDFLGLLQEVPAPSRQDPQIFSDAERKKIKEAIERLCVDR